MKNTNESKFNLDTINLIGLFIILTIIPLILKFNLVEMPPSLWDLQGEYMSDVFIYQKYKMFLLVAYTLGAINLVTFLTDSKFYSEFKERYLKMPYIGLFILALCVVLSFIFSDYRDIALKGSGQRYETIYLQFAYFIVFLVSLRTFWKKPDFIIGFILLGGALVGLIGTIQIFYPDVLSMDFFKNLYLGKEMAASATVNTVFDYSYSTLYNPNYLGLYTSMLLPICFFSMINYRKKIPMLVLSIISFVLVLGALIGARSETGYIAIAITSCLFLLFLIVKLWSNKKIALGLLSLFIIGPVLLVIAINVSPKVNGYANYVMDKFIGEDYFTDLQADDNSITVTSQEAEEKLIFENNQINIYENHALLKSIDYPNNTTENITTPLGSNITLTISDNIINYKQHGRELYFAYNNDQVVFFDMLDGTSAPLDDSIRSIGFEDHLQFLSQRGFIWSRALPIALRSPFIGHGSNSFIALFPNNDIEGRFLGGTPLNTIVDKPHDIYIDYTINTGLISVFAYLSLLLVPIFLYGKNALKEKEIGLNLLTLSLVLSVIVYMIATFAVDQNVTVSPTFWIILGGLNGIVLLKKGDNESL